MQLFIVNTCTFIIQYTDYTDVENVLVNESNINHAYEMLFKFCSLLFDVSYCINQC